MRDVTAVLACASSRCHRAKRSRYGEMTMGIENDNPKNKDLKERVKEKDKEDIKERAKDKELIKERAKDKEKDKDKELDKEKDNEKEDIKERAKDKELIK